MAIETAPEISSASVLANGLLIALLELGSEVEVGADDDVVFDPTNSTPNFEAHLSSKDGSTTQGPQE